MSCLPTLRNVLISLGLLTASSSGIYAEMRLITTTEPPTNYVYAGRFTGTTTEIVRAMRKQLGWRSKIEVYPWSRAYQIALSTPNVVVFTVGRTTEREAAGFTFIGPVSTRNHMIFSRQEFTPEDLQTVQANKVPVAIMRSDWRARWLQQNNYQIEDVTKHTQGFRMLMNQRGELLGQFRSGSTGYRQPVGLPLCRHKTGMAD